MKSPNLNLSMIIKFMEKNDWIIHKPDNTNDTYTAIYTNEFIYNFSLNKKDNNKENLKLLRFLSTFYNTNLISLKRRIYAC